MAGVGAADGAEGVGGAVHEVGARAAVDVQVLMSKNELSTLRSVLASIIDQGERTRLDATQFFDRIRSALAVMARRADFEWTAESPADWLDVPEDWPDTRFAAKARALGHEVWRLAFRRRFPI